MNSVFTVRKDGSGYQLLRTFLGTGTSASSFGPSAIFQNPGGGLFVGKVSGGNIYYDNFEVVIPEPASLGLLALGTVMMLRRRRGT